MPVSTNFAKKLHMRVKPVSMDTITIEICDIQTQEHWILEYQFRQGKVKSKQSKESEVVSDDKE